MVQQTTAGCTIIPVLSGHLQIRVPTRIPIIMLEVILLETVIREDLNHLQGIHLRRVSTDQVHPEVPEAILFRQETAWKDRVVIRVLLPAAADHIAADLPVVVLTPQVLHPQVLPRALHQEAAPHPVVVVVEDTSSLKQLNSINTDHSK